MSYTLQAILARASLVNDISGRDLTCISLDDERFCMAPLTYGFVEAHGAPFPPLTDAGTTMGQWLHDLCCSLSANGKVAYVEAEFFGGEGAQACVLFSESKSLSPPLVDRDAINHALRWLGVQRDPSNDEFTVAGLGRHRNTADWLNEQSTKE